MTINDIARMAGVSKTTVSRVLNNTGYVNQETRDNISRIIEETNYFPSATAVNLSKRESTTIGVVVPEIDNSFFAEILQGITEVCDKNDLSMLCCDTQNNAEKEARALRMLSQQRVRGVIITPAITYTDPQASRTFKKLLSSLNVPVVMVDRELEGAQWDGVYYENFQSAYQATVELIKSGHRRIGILTGDLQLKLGQDRFKGFLQAMEDHDLPVAEKDILRGDFTTDTAYRMAPISLHVEELDILDYHFSCVTRDTHGMGRTAMNLLLERFEQPDRQRSNIMVPFEVVLKGSEKIGDSR